MSRDSILQEFLDRPPGHARVLGPPASGKTTLLVERYRALVARGHSPLVIAFGREQRDRLTERVIPPDGAHLGAHPVTTHALVASEVLDAAFPGRPRTLRDVDELLVLGRVLRREPALLASDLSNIAGSATFQRDLLAAIHALAQHGISAETARACARSCPSPRARDVLSVYARHRDVCGERGLVSFYDAAWRAAECIGADGAISPLRAFDTVLVDDFHDLDPGQYHLLTRLVPAGGNIALEVFGDPTGARFAFRGTSDRYLLQSFPNDYTPLDLELAAPECSDTALRDTIGSLIEETSTTASSAPADQSLPLFAAARSRDMHAARPAWECVVSLVIADDEIAEAQAVAARARAAIDSGTPPRDIALIAREADRVRAVMQMACHEWGVPLDAGGSENGAAEDFLRSLLGALASDPDGRFAEAVAASPFFPALRGDGADADAVVRVLKRDYSARDGFDLDRLLGERVTPLLAKHDATSRATLAGISDEWRRYSEVVGHAGGGTSLDEFRTTYLAQSAARATAGNRVSLLSAREATGRSFGTAFVCGCADGFFPGSAARDGYIPLLALARAVEAVDAAAARDIVARLDESAIERAEKALFLTALTRATRSLVIAVPSRIGGESTLPARVLQVQTRSFAIELVRRSESPCARAATAVAHTLPDEARTERVRAIDATAAWWVTPPPAERWPALESFSMSASKLNSYARCARQFFYRNVLKLEEPESIYLRVGTLVHDALKEIIPVDATRDEVRAALGHAGTREIAERLVSGAMADAGPWMRQLSVTYLQKMLEQVAELEALREGNYRVRMLEEDVKEVVEGMPLRGRIDRVDDVDGLGPVVIDYKTSGSLAKTYPTLIEKMETEYWQIPVYAIMAKVTGLSAAGFVYYALPPGEKSLAVGVQLVPGNRPAPIPLGSRRPHRYGPVETVAITDAMTHAIEIHHSIVEGECRYERTENRQICPNCHFARICQRSKASI